MKYGKKWGPYVKRLKKPRDLTNFRSNPMIGKGFSDAHVVRPLYTGLRGIANSLLDHMGFMAWHNQLIDGWHRKWQVQRSENYRSNYGNQSAMLPCNSAECGCQDFFLWNIDEKVSCHYIDLLERIEAVERQVPLHEVETVLEIGGGFGPNAHLLTHRHHNIRRYYLCDIPEVLEVAKYYLGRVSDFPFKYLTPYKVGNASDAQLVWNAASFQEMPWEWLLHYKGHIDQIKPKHIVLIGSPENLEGKDYWELYPDAVKVKGGEHD